MVKPQNRNNKGMTLVEVLIVLTIGVTLMAALLSAWYFVYKNWTIEHIKLEQRAKLQTAMEWIKHEVRLSSLAEASFYPSGATEYTAISFPMATPTSGFFTLDAAGNISWSKSVIYHVSGTELLRVEKTFLSTPSARQTELNTVVSGGKTANDSVLCEGVTGFKIKPKFQLFDGYSSTAKRSERVEFGSVRLDPTYNNGYHDFKFEVEGTSGTGHGFGIDSIFIAPSGTEREAEFYYPLSFPHSHSGGSASENYMPGCSGNYYLEYSSSAVDDYVNLSLYYDLWRDSNFDNSVRTNTVLMGNKLYVQLATQEESGGLCWMASAQTASDDLPFRFPSLDEDPHTVTVRNVLSNASIDQDGVMVSVRFVAETPTLIPHHLTINEAWIAQRLSDDDATGTAVQLLFGGVANVTVPAGDEVWSDWIVFSIVNTNDYFVTLHIPSESYMIYWHDATTGPVPTHSYYRKGNYASVNAWTAPGDIESSPDIYAVGSAESWINEGTVESAIYDTKIDASSSPDYNEVSWKYNTPAGTTVGVEVRASDAENIPPATPWSSVTNGGSPSSTLDGKRYVQFKATLTSLTSPSPYTAYPWIDDVAVKWLGQNRMCDISFYFMKKPTYGIIKLTVDGQGLTKGLEFNLELSEDFQGKSYENFLTTEVEPRNTGK